MSWLYPYLPLQSGVLVKRYKRFFADIQLDSGETITAHCPNTGPMTGVCIPGNKVWVSRSDNPTRKLPYTWELIEVNEEQPVWVGVNTSLPNRVIKSALSDRLFPELGTYSTVRSEVCYGNKCRVDFVLDDALDGQDAPLTYIEVKNTTWAQGSVALFPDTVTTRGQKHLLELMALLPTAKAVMLYYINRGDCPHFAPGDRADPTYGKLLREAIALGLQVLPCRFEVTPTGIRYLGLAELKLE